MQILIDIQDNKADFMLELLNSLPFVKTKQVDQTRKELSDKVKTAVAEVNMINTGKLKGIPARDVFK